MSNEYVLGVHKETLAKVIYNQQGVFNLPVEDTFLFKDDLVVFPRHRAETSSDYKHFIAYNVITKTIDDEKFIYLYRRGAKAGEQRLKGAVSIGIGGHVNLGPINLGSRYCVIDSCQISSQRELVEEVTFKKNDQTYSIQLDRFVDEQGYYLFINDDSNEVGKVHVGITQEIEVSEDTEVHLNEPELEEIGFINLNDVSQYLPEMESWSQMLTQTLLFKYI